MMLPPATENKIAAIDERINRAIRDKVYTSIPAKVVNVDYYEQYQCVSVKPVIDDYYPLNNYLILQANTLEKVFVRLQEGGGFKIKLPVAVGDDCTLHYCHKDLDQWLDSSGDNSIEQSVNLTASLNDCYVELGFGTRKKHQNPSKTNLVIEGDATTITITPAGEVTVTTAGVCTIDTDVVISGNLEVGEDLTIGTNSGEGYSSYLGHTHTSYDGGGTTSSVILETETEV